MNYTIAAIPALFFWALALLVANACSVGLHDSLSQEAATRVFPMPGGFLERDAIMVFLMNCKTSSFLTLQKTVSPPATTCLIQMAYFIP
jgi:hypothetical protein